MHNPILVNLLMLTILIGGLYCAFTLVREMFPEIRPNQIRITTIYPGATPAEVEKGISIKIEEQVKGLEELDEMRTTIGEGYSTILLALRNDVDDVDQVVTDAKAVIDTIPREDFPEEAEETRVTAAEPRLPVISFSLYGQIDEQTLKEWGRQLRDDVLQIDGITEVVLSGTRPDEISVEVRQGRLLEFGLSFGEVANAIRRSNLDLPGGQVRTGGGNVAVRTVGEKDQAEAIGEIVVRSDARGRVIRLKDVARVVDGFEDVDLIGRYNARPSVSVTVYKTANQDAIDIAWKVKAFLAGKTGQPFELSGADTYTPRGRAAQGVYQTAALQPYGDLPGLMETHSDLSRFIEGRLDLVKRNGLWGLMLVFVTLLAFLNWRVAFWVMMGLVLSILGTLIVMKLIGMTLNLLTMFGMIVVLGMLVDDAIIIAEHIYSKVERGVPPKVAAIQGAEEVTWPVVCAIATTVAAFAPLMYIEGQMGDFFIVLPIIVIIALSTSLFEALTILPSHLAHQMVPRRVRETNGRLKTLRARFRGLQQHVLHNVLIAGYERLLRLALGYRYVTLGVAVAGLIVAAGAVQGGRVPFVPFQKMDSETLLANLEMPVGTPLAQTDEGVQAIERAGLAIPEVQSMFTLVGSQIDDWGQAAGARSHTAQVIIELQAVEERQRDSEAILRDLREQTGDIPGANALRYTAIHGGPGGRAIQLEISGERLEDIVAVCDRLKQRLGQFEGVFDIDDNFDAGRREIQIELLDSARALGLTTESLAGQVRAAFYGLEARKINRDREDVKIVVRYPESDRRQVYDVESMWIAAPDGTLVPFSEVARVREGRSYAAINRLDQRRTVTVTADVDEAVANSHDINAKLAAGFTELAEGRDVSMAFGGQEREFAKSFVSLKRDFVIAMLLIFVILAGLFRSYVQPLIVMTAIPFGLTGAVVGHYLMGYPLTVLSLIGLVALSGIVVNDSLILVSFINRQIAAGTKMFEAVVIGCKSRLRPILLTSITTVAGLAPLLAEQSFQARFLIPMGISISFGLAFATVLVLVVVPSIYLIAADLRSVGARLGRVFVSPADRSDAPAA
ncbi:MAG TPA: efflux RND transporter permease subunit [Phycisphaerae bacterium]|nr:efflux RND transporter permease subunit [Phycisphaerae bacterium]